MESFPCKGTWVGKQIINLFVMDNHATLSAVLIGANQIKTNSNTYRFIKSCHDIDVIDKEVICTSLSSRLIS